jgi:hypothetical protein
MILRGLMLAIAAFGIVSAAEAKPKSFRKVHISATSQRGAIMFVAPILFADYTLWMSPLDAETRRPTSLELFPVNPFKYVSFPTKGATAIALKDVDPGHYVVRMMTTQSWWGACLSEGTVSFEVAPGKITYLGMIDPKATLASIESEAGRTGKVTSSGGQLRLFKENVKPPSFILAGAPNAEDVLAAAKANELVTDASVETVTTTPETFVRKDKSDLTGYCQ